MNWKIAVSVLVGIAIGAVTASIVHFDGELGKESRKSEAPYSELVTSGNAGSGADADAKLLSSSGRLESTKDREVLAEKAPSSQAGSHDSAPMKIKPQSIEEALREAAAKMEEERGQRLSEDTQRLVEAGFTLDRIQALRLQRDDLRAKAMQADVERAQRGGPSDAMSYASVFDPDLFLREELSDEEYMRYRKALGKPVAITVTEVLAGSIAATAGILPGDQVLRYGGKRVFDSRELNSLASDSPTILSNVPQGQLATVDILRNGQTLQVLMPKGKTGIKGTTSSSRR